MSNTEEKQVWKCWNFLCNRKLDCCLAIKTEEWWGCQEKLKNRRGNFEEKYKRWCGLYLGITEVHLHQKCITFGNIFLRWLLPCTEHMLELSVPAWCCKRQEQGAWTGSGAYCACTVQMPQWLKNIRTYPETNTSVLIIITYWELKLGAM